MLDWTGSSSLFLENKMRLQMAAVGASLSAIVAATASADVTYSFSNTR